MNPLDTPNNGVTVALTGRSLQFSERQDGPSFRVRWETTHDAWALFQGTQTAGMRLAGRFTIGEGGKVYELEAINPNPTAGRNRSGEVYRLTLEVDEATWLWLLHNTRPADVFGVRLWRQADAPEPEAKPYSAMAQRLHRQGFFRAVALAEALGSEDTYAKWVREKPCACCNARPDNHTGMGAAIEYAHVRTLSAGSGTATKPPYHAIPLCHDDHKRQHDQGVVALYQRRLRFQGADDARIERVSREEARDWLDKQASRYRSQWAHERFRQRLGVESLGQAPPAMIREEAEQLGMGWALPDMEESHEPA